MKPTNLLLIIICISLLSCNSKHKDAKSKISQKEIVKVSLKEEKPAMIFDTLVFQENMKGKLLVEKFEKNKSELKFYRKFINSKEINNPIILNTKSTKTKIIYLGELKDLNNKNSYHVITNFEIWGIGEMDSPRGISKVAFINEDQNKIIIYDLGLPEYLPKEIDKNVLFFQIDETKVGISILGGLAPELCLPKIGCN